MAGIDLSICIPTYNRAKAVTALVGRILRSGAVGVEVVVLDNGSTDDTLVQLAGLRDERLSVHANGRNRGVLFNILHVLDKARGRHAALLLDKDGIDPESLDAFRAFLSSEPPLACGYCAYPDDPHTGTRRFARGPEALRRIGYLGHHPTGYFFDTARLRAIGYLERFSDFTVVGHFPFDFIFAELALLGDAAVYDSPLFAPESAANAAAYKSIGTNATKEDAFFSPRGRLETAIQFALHVRTLAIEPKLARALVAERFVRGILDATVNYRSIMADRDLCAHYHMTPRRIGTSALLATALHFWRRFVRDAVRLPRQGRKIGVPAFHRDVAALLWHRLRQRRRSAPA